MKTPLVLSILALAPALTAQTGSIMSTFQGGLVISNPGPAAATMYFDVQVVTPMIVTQFDINTNAPGGSVGQFAVYMTPMSLVGNENNSAAWTQVGTATVASQGNQTPCLLDTPFALPAGNYGLALHYISLNPVYTNPASAGIPLTYSNADVTLDFNAGTSRASLTNDPFSGGGTLFSPRVCNVRMNYTTASQVVDFTSDVTTGASPLTVNFRSTSASTQMGGILAYAWDFDNDGTIDSAMANPTHTYTACGTYTVSLTIVDTAGAHNMTKTNYIETDIVEPGFTTQLIAPDTLQFTDTSSPTPTSWSWDLNGDGTVDSTAQNPTFGYPPNSSCNEVDVTLTVTRLCQPPVTLMKRIAVSQALETRFDGGTFTTTTATGGANFFDLTVSNPQGVVVCGMHVHSRVPSGSTLGINVHVTPGTYAGNENSPDLWRTIGVGTTTSRGFGQQTFVTFPGGFYLPSGSYGVCVEHIGNSPYYASIGTTQTFSNADLTLTAGATQAEPVFGGGTLYSPRIWNGAIYYTTCNLLPKTGYGFFAAGCPGSLGVPGNTATSPPVIGTSMNVTVDNLAQNAALFVVGFSRTNSPLGPLPFNLGPLGAPGCTAYVSADALIVLFGSMNSATFSLALPNNSSLLCTQFYTQALSIEPGVNTLGGVVSDAAGAIIGM